MTKLQTIRLSLAVAIVWPAVWIIKTIATAIRRISGETPAEPHESDA